MLAALVAATGCLTGCAEESPDPADVFDDVTLLEGGADGAGFPVTTAHVGDSFDGLWVDALAPGEEDDRAALARGLKVFRFELEAGQTVVATMLRDGSGDLDPYLLLKDPDGTTVVEGIDQAALPMAEEADAVVTWTARATGTHFLFASSRDLRSGGGFSVDFVAMDQLPLGVDLGITNPAVRTYASELRQLQADVERYVATGFFVEGDDGLLTEGERPAEMPLSEVASARSVMSAVNNYRSHLFEEFARAGMGSDAAPSPEAVAQVGSALASLWAAL